jgi:bifunctional DNA-binding transcriptional regulator/antitoxin component of YhaV-PrlF toxin-antitoxin module
MGSAGSTHEGVSFRATILLAGKTATGVVVPDDAVEALGAGKRPPVRVTIGGYTYKSTVAVMRGRFMLPISAEVRQGAGVAAGDQVDIELVLDSEPRVVTVPADFAAALDADGEARRFFDGLSYSNQRRFVDAIAGAKAAETRARRIATSVEKLREGRT